MIDTTSATKETEKYQEYLKEHIENVLKVWKTLQKFTVDEFWMDDCTYFSIDSIIKNHDKSKYTDEEFEPYRQYFYPKNNKEGNLKWFNIAWNNHQKTNKHHWQYWVMIEDEGNQVVLDMPFYYIIELLCDWTAMSIKFNNKPSQWYKDNKDKMVLSNKTQKVIERWLPLFDNSWELITT